MPIISKPYSILAIANLLAHNNITISYYAAAKIEGSFEMLKETPLGVPIILLLIVQ